MNSQHRPLVTMRPPGAFLLWLSVGAIPLGVYLFSGPLVVGGFLGLTLFLWSRWLARRNLRDLVLMRSLPKRVLPGESFEITVQVEKKSSAPSREIELTDILAGRGGEKISLPESFGNHPSSVDYEAKAFQRGRLFNPRYRLTSRWPFGFFNSTIQGSFLPLRKGDESILVAPNPVIPPFLDRILNQMDHEAALFSEWVPDDPTDFRSLREFRPGDSLKTIHWPAVSRTNALVVRESDPPKPRPRCFGIFLHQFVPPGELYQPDRFEKILRVACGLVIRLTQRDLPIMVRVETVDRKWFEIPGKNSHHDVLDLLAELISRPVSTLDHLQADWDRFRDCDQVFVLGDWDRELWHRATIGLHPSIVCIDPFGGMVKKKRVHIPGAKSA